VVVHVLVGANWILTLHRGPVELLETFDERVRAGSELGLVDSQGFLAEILHEHAAGYLTALRPIESELDRIDLGSLTGRMNEEALLRDLVGARIRLGRLRRLLEPHRELYARLSRSEFAVHWGSDAAAEFDAVTEFLERVLSSLESARDMIAGSFDIYTTWAAHGTNQLIRRLTVASVTILPPTLLAGILGRTRCRGPSPRVPPSGRRSSRWRAWRSESRPSRSGATGSSAYGLQESSLGSSEEESPLHAPLDWLDEPDEVDGCGGVAPISTSARSTFCFAASTFRSAAP